MVRAEFLWWSLLNTFYAEIHFTEEDVKDFFFGEIQENVVFVQQYQILK